MLRNWCERDENIGKRSREERMYAIKISLIFVEKNIYGKKGLMLE